jgi:hypothetical protein
MKKPRNAFDTSSNCWMEDDDDEVDEDETRRERN